MTVAAVRMAASRGQIVPSDLASVLAYKNRDSQVKRGALPPEKRATMEAHAAPKGSMLPEARINSLYAMIGEEPPLLTQAFTARLEGDEGFIQAVTALLSEGSVHFKLLDPALMAEARLQMPGLDEDHLAAIHAAVRKAAQHIAKTLKKTVGQFHNNAGPQPKTTLSPVQSMAAKNAVLRAKTHHNIINKSRKAG